MEGNLYLDGALLRSAPKLFTAVAEGLLWIMGQPALHYLDDFLLIGASDSQQCAVALQTSLEQCETVLPFIDITILIDSETTM